MGLRSLRRVRALAIVLIAMWLVEVVNWALGHRLNAYGIEPRTVGGLGGILAAPLLHASFAHLASNTVGLAALGALVSLRGERCFVVVTVFVALAGGLATWLFARSAFHVGASLLVFGYFGYLLTRGIVERTASALIIALLVATVYGGLLFGVLPSRGTSFEGHFFGLLAGAGAASLRLTGTRGDGPSR